MECAHCSVMLLYSIFFGVSLYICLAVGSIKKESWKEYENELFHTAEMRLIIYPFVNQEQNPHIYLVMWFEGRPTWPITRYFCNVGASSMQYQFDLRYRIQPACHWLHMTKQSNQKSCLAIKPLFFATPPRMGVRVCPTSRQLEKDMDAGV